MTGAGASEEVAGAVVVDVAQAAAAERGRELVTRADLQAIAALEGRLRSRAAWPGARSAAPNGLAGEAGAESTPRPPPSMRSPARPFVELGEVRGAGTGYFLRVFFRRSAQ